MIQISVIVPFYRVAKYISRCAETLMCQSMKEDIEYIFINDASDDNSLDILMDVIDKYPERKDQIKIIKHEYNKGLPAARNTGLAISQGKYIYHCDSDDFLEYRTLEELFRTAEETNADIVWCDYSEILENCSKHKKQPYLNNVHEAICSMLTGFMAYNVWNKLVKRTLYTDNQIKFPEGHTMGEDLTMVMLFANASKISYVPKSLYNYIRTNPGAITRTFNDLHKKDLTSNINRVSQYLKEKFGTYFIADIACLKLNSKWPLLISDDKFESYRKWNDWFTEADDFIWKQPVSSRIKLVELLAHYKVYFAIWLHYWIVIMIFYKFTLHNHGVKR